MKRSDILTDEIIDWDNTEREFLNSDSVKDFIDNIESRVTDARDFLEGIDSVSDLGAVELCLELLKEICLDLY